METIELLSKQLQEYQRQNAREHEVLAADIDNKHQILSDKIDKKHDAVLEKFDELVSIFNALHNERIQDEKKIIEIENRQKEIQKDVQEIKSHQKKPEDIWNWIKIRLGIASLIIGIVVAIWRYWPF